MAELELVARHGISLGRFPRRCEGLKRDFRVAALGGLPLLFFFLGKGASDVLYSCCVL